MKISVVVYPGQHAAETTHKYVTKHVENLFYGVRIKYIQNSY